MMSLLREIQNAAVDSKFELATLLRKCKVLAARLGSREFNEWVEKELSGYQSIEALPEYRVIKVNSKGHFSGSFQSGLRNADIPMSCMPVEFRKSLSHTYLVQPIAAIESLTKSKSGGLLQEPWNPDITANFGNKIYSDMNCMQAWKVIPLTALVSATEAVRNRVLNFALEIEAESPDAGEALANSNPVPLEKVQHIFNTYITGNVQNVAAGNTSVSQSVTHNQVNDALFKNLLDALIATKDSPTEVARLTACVEEMRSSLGTSNFKKHYHDFISKLSDHMQVFGPVVGPYLPALTALLS
jgi:AbiTii